MTQVRSLEGNNDDVERNGIYLCDIILLFFYFISIAEEYIHTRVLHRDGPKRVNKIYLKQHLKKWTLGLTEPYKTGSLYPLIYYEMSLSVVDLGSPTHPSR